MQYLTKSRFAVALECPARLRYLDDPAYSNQDRTNEFLLALAEGGHQVGALAKCLFPDGVEISSSGHDAQIADTLELLAAEYVTLFEAAVRHGNLFIRIDLLRKAGDVLELYEVKAKGYDSTKGNAQIVGAKGGFVSDIKPYLYDIGFQRHVLTLAFPDKKIRSFLVMPDKAISCDEMGVSQRLAVTKRNGRTVVEADESLRDGRLARKLLHILPVDAWLDRLETDPVDSGGYALTFTDAIAKFEQLAENKFLPARPGNHCKSCQFTATPEQLAAGEKDGLLECWSQNFKRTAAELGSGTVLDLVNFRRTNDLIAAGKPLLTDLSAEDIRLTDKTAEISQSRRQWLQCEESRGAVVGPVIEKSAIKTALASLRGPLHFIDFETARPALPFQLGRRPYEQLLFQFSHHRIAPDGTIDHVSQHLDDRAGVFPNFDTVRELSSAIGGDSGAVLHWWDHERTVLKDVRLQLAESPLEAVPDRDALIAFIDSLLGSDDAPGRLFDLGRLVLRTVFLPGTAGRSSLKKVLPALLAGSESLRRKYSLPIYGADGGMRSLNFQDFTWVQLTMTGDVVDPYSLLGNRFEDPDLADAPDEEDTRGPVANGGAAMVAYGLLQSGALTFDQRDRLREQLFRYCELDTLAMVMAWEGLQELLA